MDFRHNIFLALTRCQIVATVVACAQLWQVPCLSDLLQPWCLFLFPSGVPFSVPYSLPTYACIYFHHSSFSYFPFPTFSLSFLICFPLSCSSRYLFTLFLLFLSYYLSLCSCPMSIFSLSLSSCPSSLSFFLSFFLSLCSDLFVLLSLSSLSSNLSVLSPPFFSLLSIIPFYSYSVRFPCLKFQILFKVIRQVCTKGVFFFISPSGSLLCCSCVISILFVRRPPAISAGWWKF